MIRAIINELRSPRPADTHRIDSLESALTRVYDRLYEAERKLRDYENLLACARLDRYSGEVTLSLDSIYSSDSSLRGAMQHPFLGRDLEDFNNRKPEELRLGTESHRGESNP